MAVKTFIDNMRGNKAVNGWSDEANVVQITNHIQDPAYVVVWGLDRKRGRYSFDDVCRALEAANGSSSSKENIRAELSSCRMKGAECPRVGLRYPDADVLHLPGGVD